MTDNYLDSTSVTPNSVVETMYDRYPTIVRNTAADYEQIDVTAQFFPFEDDGCTIDLDDDQRRIEYNDKAKAQRCEKGHCKPIEIVKSRYLSIKDNQKGYPLEITVKMSDGTEQKYKR